MNFEFKLKTNLLVGAGQALKVGERIKDLEFKRVKPFLRTGVIIDQAVSNTGYAADIISSIKKVSEVTILIYNIQGEPDYKYLDEMKNLFYDQESPTVDCFVGIGGGSVIDVTKGLATIMTNEGPAIKYRGFPKNLNPSLPIIAIPTTAGTGSEVTYNAVFIDWDGKLKYGINTTNNFPILAILDPILITTCPKSAMISSGMDALVHTMESYMTKNANLITKMYAKEAFKLLFNNLQLAIEDPFNIDAVQKLQIGSYLAGTSLFNSGGGPAGALSYSLGVQFKVPHGIAGAVFLPYIIEHNANHGYDFSELYNLIDDVDKTISQNEMGCAFSKKFFDLYRTLKINCSLSQFGVTHSNFDLLTHDLAGSKGAFDQNPVLFTVQDGANLIMRLMSGNGDTHGWF